MKMTVVALYTILSCLTLWGASLAAVKLVELVSRIPSY
jgi:hypothetical protein